MLKITGSRAQGHRSYAVLSGEGIVLARTKGDVLSASSQHRKDLRILGGSSAEFMLILLFCISCGNKIPALVLCIIPP
jgi:hypothetical protein